MSRAYFSPLSRRDLHEIFDYIAPKNPSAAAALIQQLKARCKQIAKSPRIGAPREDLAAGLRCFPVGSYVVFYRPVEADVEIVRIVHGARDQGRLFP